MSGNVGQIDAFVLIEINASTNHMQPHREIVIIMIYIIIIIESRGRYWNTLPRNWIVLRAGNAV